MEKIELISSYAKKESKFYCLVGPNTTGKTYILNLAYDNLSNRTLFIDETGLKKSKDIRSKVEIFNNQYIYRDDRRRGSSDREYECEEILPNSQKIITFVKKYIGNVNTKNKSLGSTKLFNILNAFISYNLNNIDYILIDEPENSLDDENLKIIGLLLKTLMDNNKYVFIVTHSPRLLELLDVKIDDIYYLKRMFGPIVNVKFDDVVEVYKKNWESISAFEQSFTFSETDKYDFVSDSPMMNVYLEELLSSSEFYRTLFYTEVIIVEGITEKLVIKKLADWVSYSNNYFVANGKNKIPFLIKLFTLLTMKVTCFIDTDYNEGDEQMDLPVILTKYIEQQNTESIKIISIEKDIEDYLGVDKASVVKALSGRLNSSNTFIKNFFRKYKSYICYFVLSTDAEKLDLAKKLFSESQTYEF